MIVLNLSSDYSRQKIYKNLAQALAGGGIDQDIYVPVRTAGEAGKHRPEVANTEIKYRHILTKWDRLLYKSKINKVFGDVKREYNLADYDVVHAHFMFSDGGVAYKIWQETGIPYLVAVRNTDVNFFLKYALHLRYYGKKILAGASQVILPSPAYKERFLSYFDKDFAAEIARKIKVMPNGIDDFWFSHLGQPKQQVSGTLLYVGDFTPNKNVPFLIETKQKYFPAMDLVIAGSNGDDEEKIKSLAANDDRIKLMGRITDQEQLRKIYGEADILCILSKYETFGLAYIEALSQGTPIIYTRGQGVDGLFDKAVGKAIPFQDQKALAGAIDDILGNYHQYSINAVNNVGRFSWDTISKEYIKIYEKFGA